VDRLVRRFMPDLTRWAHGRLPHSCRPLDDTQTIVLDTLRSAIAHLATFEYRREGAFMAYLRAIFMNKLRDRYRWAASRPQTEALGPNVQGQEDPTKPIEREEFWDLYNKALRKLPERMAEAVFLRLELEWDYERIAAAIGSPTANAARMYVTRGIGRLAKEMHHDGF
jgi:RNA polymerase sigma factor (sigma-70 family)